MKRNHTQRACLAVCAMLLAAAADAGPIVLYQGRITDAGGSPKSGTFLLNFSIDGGPQEWSEGVFVRAREGGYRVTLGTTKTIPDAAVSGSFTVSAAPPSGAGWKSESVAAPLVVRGGGVVSAAPPSRRDEGAAESPGIDYQGTLSDAQGNMKTGTFLMRFEIFPGTGGGKPAWESERYLRVENGAFRIRLGESKPLPVEILRGSYRITASGPAGLGWTVKAAALPALHGILPAGPHAGTSGDAAASALEEVRGEMERVQKAAREASRKAESSQKRIEALEQRLRKSSAEAPESSKSGVYVVKAGDTLRTISQKVYGSEDRWTEIYQANHDRMLRGGEVVPGQRLLIPASGR